MINKELEAQIRLLEDPDKQIYSLIHESIVQRGIDAIPVLEQAWDNSLLPIVHQRIEDIIHDINFNQILEAVEKWSNESRKDWFNILFLISKFYFQNLNKALLIEEFTKIKNEIWLEINDNLTAFEKIQILNHILFKKYQISQTKEGQEHIQNYFLSEALVNKKGNDLSIGLLYLLICAHLNWPVYGVNLPGNLILAYLDTHPQKITTELKDEVLFYINPINNGTVFGVNEIDMYLEQNNLKAKDQFYNPISYDTLLKRYLDEISQVLKQNGEDEKLNELEQIKQIIIDK